MRSVAFLRGINVGGHRVTKDRLIAVFEALGFGEVTTFLASGNVLFSHDDPADEASIADALADALGYDVPTTVRAAARLNVIAPLEPFSVEAIAASTGKPQVILLFSEPTGAQQAKVLALVDTDDLLVFDGQELHWLPPAGLSDSDLDLGAITKLVGPTTTRTGNTINRLLAKL